MLMIPSLCRRCISKIWNAKFPCTHFRQKRVKIRLNGATLVNGRSENWQCGRNSASVEAERKAADETRD